MRLGSLASILVVTLPFILDGWVAQAIPSTALVLSKMNLASDAPYSDLSDDDKSINLVMEMNAPWEDFLMPCPVIISLLGQLMVISTKRDFSLAGNAPQGGFKYIKHPESFRTCLDQVANEGWEAFMNAHTNMNQIKLRMEQIPAQVKTVTKVLSHYTPAQAKSIMPIPMKKMQEMAQSACDLAKETEDKFGGLMHLTAELLEASTSGKGEYQIKLDKAQAELNATKEQEAAMEQYGQTLKDEAARLDSIVSDLRDKYDAALASIPTGWKAMVMRAFNGVADAVRWIGGHGSSHSHPSGDQPTLPPEIDVSMSMSYENVNKLSETIEDMKRNVKNYFDKKPTTGDPSSMVESFNGILTVYENSFKRLQCRITNQALGFIDTARSITAEVDKLMKQLPPIDHYNQTDLPKKFDDLSLAMKPLLAEAAQASDGSYATQPIDSGGDDVGDNEMFKVKLAQKALERAEESRSRVFERTMQYYDQMKDLVGILAHINLEEIDFEQIVDILNEGIKMLGKLREEWSKLVRFFSAIATRTEVLTNTVMVPFLDTAEQAETIFGEGDKKDAQFFLKLLEAKATEVNKDSYFLYTVSGTYVDVSSRYLLDRLAYLPKLLSAKIDERQDLLQDLNKNLNETQDAIMEIAKEKRQNYNQLISARQSEFEKLIDKLGGPDGNDTKIIDKAFDGK